MGGVETMIIQDSVSGSAMSISSPNASDLATAITLVNEIKAAINADTLASETKRKLNLTLEELRNNVRNFNK